MEDLKAGKKESECWTGLSAGMEKEPVLQLFKHVMYE
jgi:hypothetical protein